MRPCGHVAAAGGIGMSTPSSSWLFHTQGSHVPPILDAASLVVPPLPMHEQRREVQAVEVRDDGGHGGDPAGEAPRHTEDEVGRGDV